MTLCSQPKYSMIHIMVCRCKVNFRLHQLNKRNNERKQTIVYFVKIHVHICLKLGNKCLALSQAKPIKSNVTKKIEVLLNLSCLNDDLNVNQSYRSIV